MEYDHLLVHSLKPGIKTEAEVHLLGNGSLVLVATYNTE
jgi:hypothetical protein